MENERVGEETGDDGELERVGQKLRKREREMEREGGWRERERERGGGGLQETETLLGYLKNLISSDYKNLICGKIFRTSNIIKFAKELVPCKSSIVISDFSH